MRFIFQLAIGSNNNQSLTIINNNIISNVQDIYFIYGDSDFQSIKIGDELQCSDKYYKLMCSTFKLLLMFKPLTSRIAISASSLISSRLTSKLIDDYKIFSTITNPHFYLLRKEVSWKDYSDKRAHNTRRLRHLKKYSLFLDQSAIMNLSDYIVLGKDNCTGVDTSQSWIVKAKKIIPTINQNPKSRAVDIDDLPEEILNDSIFVWEAVYERLCQRDILIPKWDKQLQIALLESYLTSYSNHFVFPIRDTMSTVNFNTTSTVPFYLNLQLLNNIIICNNLQSDFDRITPDKLIKLIYCDELLKFKMMLEDTNIESAIFLKARKYSQLLQKAINYVNK